LHREALPGPGYEVNEETREEKHIQKEEWVDGLGYILRIRRIPWLVDFHEIRRCLPVEVDGHWRLSHR
jgi:hypothetical protein